MTKDEIIKKIKDSAFPQTVYNGESIICGTGLTKREYFAAMAFQGLLANPNISCVSSDAVLYADKLIEELNK
jgi:hypothetical protein